MAFLLLGLISLSIGLANFACASEPRSFDPKLPFGLPAACKAPAESSAWAKFKATLWDIKSVVTVPTFAIIIVQVWRPRHVLPEHPSLLQPSWGSDFMCIISAESRKLVL